MWWGLFLITVILLWLFHERKRPLIGTVSLMKDPHQLETWIRYHKKIGVSKIYIYWDSEIPYSGADESVTVYQMTPEFLAEQNYTVDPNWDNPTKWNEKQRVAVDHALAHQETEWLFHIDSDELLYVEGDKSLEELMESIDPDVDTCVINNYELAPDHENYKNCFVEGTKFRRGQNMVAYGNGKGCGRTGTTAYFGPHRFESKRGAREYQFPDEQLKLLHYVSCNLDEYMKKYELYGKFSDDIWGWAEHHRKSRDVLTTCESKEACTSQAREMFLEQRPPRPNEPVVEINIAKE